MPDYFRGSTRFFGTHDTQIPLQAAINAAERWLGGGVSLWNWYDQVDLSYAHLTTGWWTVPSTIEGVFLAALDTIVGLDGLQVTQVHALIWVASALLIASFGLLLLMDEISADPLVAVPVTAIGLAFLMNHVFFYYLTAFLYALVPISLVLTRRVFLRPSPSNITLSFLLLLLMLSQSALFTVSYALVPAFFLLISLLVVHVYWAIRQRSLRSNFLRWVDAVRVRQWRQWLTTRNGKVLASITAISYLLFCFLYVPLFYSFRENFFLSDARLEQGPWSLPRLLAILPNGGDLIHPLDSSINGSASSGWSYWGILFLGLAAFALIRGPRLLLLPLGLAAFSLVLLQMSTLGGESVWRLGILPKLLVFYLYPGGFLFRSPTMVTPLIALLVIPLVGWTISWLSSSLLTARSGSTRSTRNSWIVAGTALGASCGWAISSSQSQQAVNHVTIAVVGALASWVILVLLDRFHKFPRAASPVLILLILAVTLTLEVNNLKGSLSLSPFFGKKVEAKSLERDNLSTPSFIPEYRALRRALNDPHQYVGLPPRSEPPGPSPAQPDKPEGLLDASGGYFNPQTSTNLFWETNMAALTQTSAPYQQTSALLRNFFAANPTGLPTQSLSSSPTGSTQCPPVGSDQVHFAAQPKQAFLPAETLALNLPVGASSPVSGTSLYEIPLSAEWHEDRSNVFAETMPHRVTAGDVELRPVQGLPVEPFSYDLGNWKYRTLTVALPDGEEPSAVALERLVPGHSATRSDVHVMSQEYAGSSLTLQLQVREESCLTLLQPNQSGWTIAIDGQTSRPTEGNPFVTMTVPPGDYTLQISFEPFGGLSAIAPYLFRLLPIVLLITLLQSFRTRPVSEPGIGRSARIK